MAQYDGRPGDQDWYSMSKLGIFAGIETGIFAKNMFQAVNEFSATKEKAIVKRGDADEV